MKKVQIDYELFRKLIFYHLGSDTQYADDIRNGLEEKLDSLVRHELYTKYKTERLREEVSVIKKENVALLNVAYDMDRVVIVLGENKVKEAVEVAKHLEQANAKQKIKKRRIDRDDR